MLLPASEELDEDEGEDPREELIRRLLEYQRYKEAAELFQKLPQLERDVFTSYFKPPELIGEEETAVAIGVYQLADAFHRLMNGRPVEVFHEVIQEPLSVATYVELIVERLREHRRVCFRDFFSTGSTRNELVVTFLAMLELVKMRMINVEQVDEFSELWLSAAVAVDQLTSALLIKDELTYG